MAVAEVDWDKELAHIPDANADWDKELSHVPDIAEKYGQPSYYPELNSALGTLEALQKNPRSLYLDSDAIKRGQEAAKVIGEHQKSPFYPKDRIWDSSKHQVVWRYPSGVEQTPTVDQDSGLAKLDALRTFGESAEKERDKAIGQSLDKAIREAAIPRAKIGVARTESDYAEFANDVAGKVGIQATPEFQNQLKRHLDAYDMAESLRGQGERGSPESDARGAAINRLLAGSDEDREAALGALAELTAAKKQNAYKGVVSRTGQLAKVDMQQTASGLANATILPIAEALDRLSGGSGERLKKTTEFLSRIQQVQLANDPLVLPEQGFVSRNLMQLAASAPKLATAAATGPAGVTALFTLPAAGSTLEESRAAGRGFVESALLATASGAFDQYLYGGLTKDLVADLGGANAVKRTLRQSAAKWLLQDTAKTTRVLLAHDLKNAVIQSLDKDQGEQAKALIDAIKKTPDDVFQAFLLHAPGGVADMIRSRRSAAAAGLGDTRERDRLAAQEKVSAASDKIAAQVAEAQKQGQLRLPAPEPPSQMPTAEQQRQQPPVNEPIITPPPTEAPDATKQEAQVQAPVPQDEAQQGATQQPAPPVVERPAQDQNAAPLRDVTPPKLEKSPAGGKLSGSWIVSRKDSGEVVGEFYDENSLKKFDPSKVNIETASDYLGRINSQKSPGDTGQQPPEGEPTAPVAGPKTPLPSREATKARGQLQTALKDIPLGKYGEARAELNKAIDEGRPEAVNEIIDRYKKEAAAPVSAAPGEEQQYMNDVRQRIYKLPFKHQQAAQREISDAVGNGIDDEAKAAVDQVLAKYAEGAPPLKRKTKSGSHFDAAQREMRTIINSDMPPKEKADAIAMARERVQLAGALDQGKKFTDDELRDSNYDLENAHRLYDAEGAPPLPIKEVEPEKPAKTPLKQVGERKPFTPEEAKAIRDAKQAEEDAADEQQPGQEAERRRRTREANKRMLPTPEMIADAKRKVAAEATTQKAEEEAPTAPTKPKATEGSEPEREPTVAEHWQAVFDAASDVGKSMRSTASMGGGFLGEEGSKAIGRLVGKTIEALYATGKATLAEFRKALRNALEDIDEWKALKKGEQNKAFSRIWKEALPEWDKASARSDRGEPITGTKQAWIEKERRGAGQPEIQREPQKVAAIESAAREFRQNNPLGMIGVIAKLKADPQQPPTPMEDAALGQHLADLYRHFIEASEGTGDESKAAMAEYRQQLNDLEETLHRAHSAWGRAGRMMQEMRKLDGTPVGVERRFAAAKAGKPLSDAERALAAELGKKLEAANADLQATTAKLQESESSLALERAAKELADRLAPKDRSFSERTISALRDERAKIMQRFKDRHAGLASGSQSLDITSIPGLLANDAIDLTLIGGTYIAEGAAHFAGWAKRMSEDFGETYDKLADESKQKLFENSKSAANEYAISGLKGDEAEAEVGKIAPKPSKPKGEKQPVEKPAKGAKAPRTPEQVADRIKKLTPGNGRRLLRAMIQAGVHGTENLSRTAHELLKKKFPDVTRTEVNDFMSGRGKQTKERKDAISREVVDVGRQLSLIENIQGLKKAPAEPPKGMLGIKKQEPSERESQLRHELYEEKQKHPELMPRQPGDLQTALSTTLRRLDGVIKRLEAANKKGELKGKERKAPIVSKEVSARNQRIEQLRAVRDELRSKDPQYQADLAAKQMSLDKARLVERKAILEERLAKMERTGELPEKKPLPSKKYQPDREIVEKRQAVEQLWKQVRQKEAELQRGRFSTALTGAVRAPLMIFPSVVRHITGMLPPRGCCSYPSTRPLRRRGATFRELAKSPREPQCGAAEKAWQHSRALAVSSRKVWSMPSTPRSSQRSTSCGTIPTRHGKI